MYKHYVPGAVILVLLAALAFALASIAPVPAPVAAGPAVSQSGNIKVIEPTAGQVITSPLRISGEARVFEGAYNFRLLDASGHEIAGGFDTAFAAEPGEFGYFSAKMGFQVPIDRAGTLEVFTHSAKDGAEIDMVRIPVFFHN